MTWFTRGRLITLGAVAVVFLVLAAVAPEIYTGTFSDAGTFARVALVVAVLAGWAIAIRRLVPHEVAATALAVVPAVVATAIFVWPYVRPATEVDEAFPPVEAAARPPTSAAPTTTPPPTTITAPTTTAPTATAPTTTAPTATTAVPSGGPESTASATAPAATSTAAPTTTTVPTTTSAPTTTVPTTTVPPAPVEVRRAAFQGLTGHRGSGDAVLYDLGNGPRLLRFEDVDIGSGPALNVYVVPGADRRGLGDAIFVAPLTAERGNQNYDVPGGVDLTDGTWTVLVWCETFDVEVANATL